MKHILILTTALEVIEQNLNSNIKTSDIAKACYCSKSSLEKMFRCINDISVHDYILRRKMSLAAKEIYANPKTTLLDIALKFGYSSNEAFTRAFEQIWHCKPSTYRKQQKYYELYPRLLCPLENGDDYMENRKHVDISELYDLFQERKDCYFVCFDIVKLIPINEIARAAGDLAILETLNRISSASGAEDITFRIGGDEFVLLTNSKDSSYAQQIAEQVAKQNGKTFTYEGREIPLKLHITTTKLENTQNYADLFTNLHTSIQHFISKSRSENK